MRRSLFTRLSGPEEQREVGDGGGEEVEEEEIKEKGEKGHGVLPGRQAAFPSLLLLCWKHLKTNDGRSDGYRSSAHKPQTHTANS